MWPWEHLAVGYLLYSLGSRILTGETPRGAAAIAVVVGTQFPDVVDKPLAWSFDLVHSGVGIFHSVFVATVLAVAAGLVARHYSWGDVGAGFAVGYLSHLPADMLYPLLLGRASNVTAFLWPLAEAAPATRTGFLDNLGYYLAQFVHFLGTPRGLAFLVLEVVLVGLTTWLWIADGCPALPRFERTRSALGDS